MKGENMYGPPPTYGTRKNPKTGKIETYEINPSGIDLETSRKEFRDFITGNFQWHDDPYAAPKEKLVEPDISFEDDQYADFYNNYSTNIT